MKFTAFALVLSLAFAGSEYGRKSGFSPDRRGGSHDEKKIVVIHREEHSREHSRGDDRKIQVPIKIVRAISPKAREYREFRKPSAGKVVVTAKAVHQSNEYANRVVHKELHQLQDQQELLAKANKIAAKKASFEAKAERHRSKSEGKSVVILRRDDHDDDRKIIKIVRSKSPVQRQRSKSNKKVFITGEDIHASKNFSKKVIKKDLHNIVEQQELLQRKNVHGFATINERVAVQNAQVAHEQHEFDEKQRRLSNDHTKIVIAKPVRVATETRVYGLRGPFVGQWKKGDKHHGGHRKGSKDSKRGGSRSRDHSHKAH